jgi:hypothetical protein
MVIPSTSRTHKLAGVAFGFGSLPAGQGSALEIEHEVRLRVWNTSNTSNSNQNHPFVRGDQLRKEDSAVAKFHARPSNQYRYEHYDPRF